MLNSILIFLLILRLVPRPTAAGALIAACHPLQVESVVCCMGRNDLLVAACVLAVRHLFLSRLNGKLWCYPVITGMFALGLLAKPAILLLPLCFALVVTMSSRKPCKHLWSYRMGMAVLSGVAYFLSARLAPSTPPSAPDVMTRLCAIPNLIGDTVLRVVCLKGFSPVYPWPELSLTFGCVSLLGIACGVSLAFTINRYSQSRLPIALITLMFIPAMGILTQYRQFFTADRYAYLPMIGIAWDIALLVHAGLQYKPRPVEIAIGRLIIVVMMITHFTISTWQSELALWQRAARYAPDSSLVQNNLGSACANAKRYKEAALAYKNALFIEAENFEAWNNLGELYLKVNNRHDATRCLTEAVRVAKAYPTASHNLGVIKFRQKRFKEAVPHFRYALAGQRQHPASFFSLGLCFKALNDHPKTIICFQQAVKRAPHNPNYPKALHSLSK